MGTFDELKDLAKKAEGAIGEHPDQAKAALDKAVAAVDEKTGGKYHDKLAKADSKAEEFVDKQAGRGR